MFQPLVFLFLAKISLSEKRLRAVMAVFATFENVTHEHLTSFSFSFGGKATSFRAAKEAKYLFINY